MTAIKTTSPGLRNPALIAAAKTPAGQQAIGDAIHSSQDMVAGTMKVAGTVLLVAAIAAASYMAYKAYENRFVAIGTNSGYDPANISDAQAKAKADAIYQAMVGIGANKEKVGVQLNGLNYNGWVKVYNAFGKKQGAIPFSAEMNLVEWLQDQFNEDELNYLRFFINGVF